MKYLKKIDIWIFALVTKIVVGWVKRKKFSQHKFDFFILMHGWEIAMWIVAILYAAITGILQHKILAASLVVAIMSVFMVVAGTGFRLMLKSEKEDYDILFARRKDPNIYKLVKEVNSLLYQKGWPRRAIPLMVNIIAFVYFGISSHSPVTPMFIFNIMHIYQNYIFDFDEPEKKDKKKKASLTEIMSARWRAITAPLAPQN